MDKIGKAVFFVDGFNLYHSLNDNPAHRNYRKYKWLDLDKLCRCFITKTGTIVKIFFFTTYVTWNPSKVQRHKAYIKALEQVKVIPVFGKFKHKTIRCMAKCKQEFVKPVEKQTDVNISITMLKEAMIGTYDTAFIVSGDSDLVPAIQGVKDVFPEKQIIVVIPPGRSAEDLKGVSDGHRKIKEKHLKTCQFPDTVVDDKGQPIVSRPKEWT